MTVGDELRVGPADWPAAVSDTDGRQLIVGGPGTGKTEFLVRRISHLLESGVAPDELIVLSFGRRSVSDLQRRLRSMIPGSLGAIEIATYHSFAARLLEVSFAGRWQQMPQILTGPEQTGLVRRLLADERPEAWSVAFRPLLSSATFAVEVTDLVLRAAEQMLTVDDLRAVAEDRADWKGIPDFVDRYRKELRRISRVDYGELLGEALVVLSASDGPGAELTDRVKYVVVDEYQDTTAIQVEMLDALSRSGNLCVAADPYQSIYSFRGSDVHNVAAFTERHPEARRIVLTTSFRTPRAILDASERVTAGDIPGSAGPVIPAAAEGRIDVEVFEQLTQEAEWIASEIQRIHLTDRVPLSRVAVFVRSKRRFLPELSRALERRDIAHDMPDARLIDQPAVRLVLDLVAAATEPDGSIDQTTAIRRVLLGDLIGVSLSTSRDLDRRRTRSGSGWSAVLRSDVPGGRAVADLIDDDTWATEVPASDGLWRLWTTLPQIQEIVDDPAASDTRAAWSSLMQVLSRWNERNPVGTLADFRNLTDDADFEAQPLLSYRSPQDDRVTLTTLHQSKGLEFDIVFIADAVEGVFPDLRARDSLLGVRHILPHLPIENAAYVAFRLQEERRLAYTAMTRASQRVVWTATTTGAEEGHGVRSRFLSLVAGVDDPSELRPSHIQRAPVTPAEAEARLRQIVADPTASATQRVAALETLAAASEFGLRPIDRFAGMLPRGEDGGIVGTPLFLSPSQADLYRTCPRRYALERRLHISDESVYMRFGTLVHDVLEQAERTATDAGRPRSTLEEALSVLDEIFDPIDFGGGHVAEHWRRRAERGLRHLYEHWPKASGPAVKLELGLEVELAGATWVGKADRVERRGDGLAIVDYKTSTSSMTRADAARSIQLGFYAHAAAAHPQIAELGEVLAAEFWYPLQTRRKSLAVVPFEMANVEEVIDELADITEGIASEDWTPTPGDWCTRCAVASSCPAVAAGGDGFA
jgi:superfamily I DNA/RNA helicase/CRISPR/Cas system-associated exonuclease Cas4 (RecB family)